MNLELKSLPLGWLHSNDVKIITIRFANWAFWLRWNALDIFWHIEIVVRIACNVCELLFVTILILASLTSVEMHNPWKNLFFFFERQYPHKSHNVMTYARIIKHPIHYLLCTPFLMSSVLMVNCPAWLKKKCLFLTQLSVLSFNGYA